MSLRSLYHPIITPRLLKLNYWALAQVFDAGPSDDQSSNAGSGQREFCTGGYFLHSIRLHLKKEIRRNAGYVT